MYTTQKAQLPTQLKAPLTLPLHTRVLVPPAQNTQRHKVTTLRASQTKADLKPALSLLSAERRVKETPTHARTPRVGRRAIARAGPTPEQMAPLLQAALLTLIRAKALPSKTRPLGPLIDTQPQDT